ncbi:MAG: PqiC family protein [Phycisphaerae bacterium]
MIHRSLPVFVIVTTALLLGGCSSGPPTQLITTSAVAEPAHPYIGPPVLVGRVTIPPQMDRLWLTRSAGNGHLQVSNDTRWAAPLAILIRHTVAVDLSRALTLSEVIIPGEPGPRKSYVTLSIVITRLRISTAAHGAAHLDMSTIWALVRHHRPPQIHHLRITSIPEPNSGSAADALSRAIGKLADAIAMSLVRSNPPRTAISGGSRYPTQ